MVVCIDPPSEDKGVLEAGSTYVIDYWDGSSIHVYDDTGLGVTLWHGRFEPFASTRSLTP